LILSKSDGARPLNPCHLKIKLTLSHLSRSDGIRPLLQNLCERFKNEAIKYLFHETLALEQIADFLHKSYRWTMTLPSQMPCKYSRIRIFVIRMCSFEETWTLGAASGEFQ